MSVLLSYDIRKTTDTIHSELKDRLVDHYGYSNQIRANTGVWYMLPNTTLRKDSISTNVASNEFLQACRDVGAHWEKYIALEYSNATFDNQR